MNTDPLTITKQTLTHLMSMALGTPETSPVYLGNTTEEVAIAVMRHATEQVNEILRSAKTKNMEVTEVDIRLINIPDAEINPECLNGYVRTIGYANSPQP